MLNISRVSNSSGKVPALFIKLFVSFSLLLIICASALAQSSADLAATHDWVKSKAQDRSLRASFRNNSGTSKDPCDWGKGGTGPFDPSACIDKQIKEWLAMSTVARGDAQASPTVKNTIPKIIEGLNTAKNQWKALSPAEKDRQIAIRKEILESVSTSDNNVEQALQKIINDSGRSQETRNTARALLAGVEKWGGRGGGKCIMYCNCCCPEGCPCCGYDYPSDIWGSQTEKTFPN